jgi:hypothetical protein
MFSLKKAPSLRITLSLMLAIALGAGLSGCELIGLFAGHGSQAALYVLPKDARVIVLVDLRKDIEAPAAFASNLGDQITAHLYTYKATDHVIGQAVLVDLERNNPKYAEMGVADVAAATGADVVVVVDVVMLSVTSSSDNMVHEGAAEAYVKVIDRNGNRLWPGDNGMRVNAKVDPKMNDDVIKQGIFKNMQDTLTVRIGRMFHSYSLDDSVMSR